jgi:hypothetical protein
MSHELNSRLKNASAGGDVDAAGIIFYGSYIRSAKLAKRNCFVQWGWPYGKVFDEPELSGCPQCAHWNAGLSSRGADG